MENPGSYLSQIDFNKYGELPMLETMTSSPVKLSWLSSSIQNHKADSLRLLAHFRDCQPNLTYAIRNLNKNSPLLQTGCCKTVVKKQASQLQWVFTLTWFWMNPFSWDTPKKEKHSGLISASQWHPFSDGFAITAISTFTGQAVTQFYHHCEVLLKTVRLIPARGTKWLRCKWSRV